MREQRGFTLMMVSVGIVLISLFAAASIGFRASQSSIDSNQITIHRMNTINDALIRFAALNGRLPCPASPTATPSSSIYGTESRTNDAYFICNAPNIIESSPVMRLFLGAVPTRTLGLPDEYMIDGWGNKLEYSPSPYLYKNYNEDNLGNYLGTDAVIVVNNENGTAIESNAAYIIISRGANGYGAYNAYSSNRNAYPPASLPIERGNMECNNSSCGASVFDANYQLSNSPANSDDILVYKNKTDFINDCFIKTNSPNCLTNQCVNSTAAANWQNAVRTTLNKEEVMIISSKTIPPTLDLSTFQLNRAGNPELSLTVNEILTTNATITLSYTYTTTTNPSTEVTTNIATFSAPSSTLVVNFAPTNFSSSRTGNTIKVTFGEGDQLFKRLNFTITNTSSPSNAYMAVSNINLADNALTTFINGQASVQLWYGLSNTVNTMALSGGFNAPQFITLQPKKFSTNPLERSDLQDYFFQKIYGYITPTSTNNYNFYISSDDDSAFWIEDDSNGDNRLIRRAFLKGNKVDPYTWTTYPTQQSAAISLTANKSYYFEIWHKNGPGGGAYGGGYVNVGWKTQAQPNSSISLVASTFLSRIPKNLISSPPTCKAFYSTTATLTPAQTIQSADIIPLNNTRGRYVKLSLLSSQPTGSGQDPRQDVYHLGQAQVYTSSGTALTTMRTFASSSSLYVDNGSVSNDLPFQPIGLFDGAPYGTSQTFSALSADFIASASTYRGKIFVTQNTRSPQYVIIDLGASYQLRSIAIWNGNQLFTSGGVTCCPGRSVKDVRVSVSDDIAYLLSHAA
ncbi:prepilin-type N-terminal cleavage/methylation domain-containing protein [endosymbiont of Acanthamoeba sp. UWC8]|uniref:PA14 domain-containing protein n=1 Tax=endosymbiont of Acanthamoeba sp. UWC8 TaxID=86106 RepID=UPI0004D1EC17|nr:PA14 domain-containing protein [endosymbiont of Acanthamoeba sp. UWC8]AIF81580.1 prepilin-type N-terminal cleavage/methylation domain-containing protein [endosymbiont of Acanthamoeba sp. UWC8]